MVIGETVYLFTFFFTGDLEEYIKGDWEESFSYRVKQKQIIISIYSSIFIGY